MGDPDELLGSTLEQQRTNFGTDNLGAAISRDEPSRAMENDETLEGEDRASPDAQAAVGGSGGSGDKGEAGVAWGGLQAIVSGSDSEDDSLFSDAEEEISLGQGQLAAAEAEQEPSVGQGQLAAAEAEQEPSNGQGQLAATEDMTDAIADSDAAAGVIVVAGDSAAGAENKAAGKEAEANTAVEAALADLEGPGGDGAAGRGTGGLGALLSKLQAAAGRAVEAAAGELQEKVGRHVRIAPRSGDMRISSRLGDASTHTAAARSLQVANKKKSDKKQSMRAIKRAEKKYAEKEAVKKERLARKMQTDLTTQAIMEMIRPENLAACAALLTQFAEACQKGDKAQVMLLHESLFSERNQVIQARGLPPVRGLPWQAKSLADFLHACYVLAIRGTGNVDLANTLEKLNKQHAADGGDLADFSRLVSVLAAEEDAWKQMYGPDGRPDKELFQAKRPLMHEWITEGYLDVLTKAIHLSPKCINAPVEPPLVTALQAGHSKELVSLLLEPCVKYRPRGVDEASPTDGATAVGLALRNNRADVLGQASWHVVVGLPACRCQAVPAPATYPFGPCSAGWLTAAGWCRVHSSGCHRLLSMPCVFLQLLKHSTRWTMMVEGKAWTPLCYGLAQGRAGLVPLLLAHAKKNKPEAAELAEYVNELCEGSTALHRALVADAPDMVRLLLESGADPTILTRQDGRVTSALHLAAASREQRPLLEAMLETIPPERLPSVLNTLVDAGDNSLLHVAVARGAVPLAQLLLDKGARPTSQSERRSPLLRLLRRLQGGPEGGAGRPGSAAEGDAEQWDTLREIEAAFLQSWQLEDTIRALNAGQKPTDAEVLRSWLLQHRAHTLDACLADPSKRRLLGQAAVDDRNQPLLELLLEEPSFSAHGLYLHRLIDRVRGTELELMQRLFDAGASVLEKQPPNATPLLHKARFELLSVGAAAENDLACLEALLARGAEVQATDVQGNTALHAVAAQKERAGVLSTAVVARLFSLAPQLVTTRNEEFFLPADAAPAGSAVEAHLEALTKRQQDAAMVAEEVARWDAAAKDLSLMGPPNEDPDRKRLRIDAMLASKLSSTVNMIQRHERLGHTSTPGETASSSGGGGSANLRHRHAAGAGTEPAAPATPTTSAAAAAASSVYRQRPRKRGWADLADEMPVVIRLPVWPEVLEAAAAAARADPVAAVAQILKQAAPEGPASISSLRRQVLQLLLRIGAGRFDPDPSNSVQRVSGSSLPELQGIEVYLARLPKSVCVVFEVTPEVDVRRSTVDASGERYLQYHDVLRIWAVSLHEGRPREALDLIASSYRKGRSARRQLLLEARPRPGASGPVTQGVRLPSDYDSKCVDRAAAAEAAAAIAAEAASRGGGEGLVRRHYCPPASTEADSYTIIKFHPLEDSMLHAVMTNEGQTDVDFKFRLSPAEADVVERSPYPPQSIILLGRSGTGKTTCAVFRMFDHWRRAFEEGQSLHQVAKAFVRLRNGLPAVTPDRAAAYAAAAARPYHSFRDVPEAAWPLFLSGKQYLHMLDGTLAKPFFKRYSDGSFVYESEARDDDDGMSMLVDLAGAAADRDAAAAAAGEGEVRSGAVEEGARIKVTFPLFQNLLYRRLCGRLNPEFDASLVWQEIVSYIKGTKQAVEGSGRLSEEQYLKNIGRKQAPNFDRDSRRRIYEAFLAYEGEKKKALTEGHVSHFMYDAADVVAWLHRGLREEGYRGQPIHEYYCDEVQDFTQAELLLSLRVVADPNGLFLCGDTCQTIARGIGFRFTDLFFQEQREAQLAKQAAKRWEEAAVQMPDIVPLEINYRTHSGVLDVAAAIVQLLRRFFAEQIDDLKPEQAFLEAPHLPLLLPAATPGSVAMLLSGGDTNETWKTEFGANQVVLRRTLASSVPPFLRKIDAVIMTVPQAKGLEFNDVFILNFFADSPCKEEWRVLLQYLAEVEERGGKGGEQALPFRKPLAAVTPADLGFSSVRLDALNFDESQHKLLCEELKHLYTAVTRAKNAVVFFDSDLQSHAPFYYLLARLGLARVVPGTLKLEEGKDLHQLGLSKSKSTPADWIRRAQSMVGSKNFEAAATCYRKAGNGSRSVACQAQARLQAAAQMDEEQLAPQAESLRFEAGYALLATAVNAPPHEANPTERCEWLLLAAAALKAAGQELAAMRIRTVVGQAGLGAAAGGAVRG
ncbi:TPR and ankyrin repeat-containing protein 1 [Chlorella vulgaris]